jgi:hypothetical protein
VTEFNHQDIKIIQALNDGEWGDAADAVRAAVKDRMQLHPETLLLIAEKLTEAGRQPLKRRRGHAARSLDDFVDINLRIGRVVDLRLRNMPTGHRRDVRLEWMAEQLGISRRTLEKHRATYRRLRRDLGHDKFYDLKIQRRLTEAK